MGEELIASNVIYISLALILLVVGGIYIQSKTSSSVFLEEVLAKEVALIIDNAEPGMNINLDLTKILEQTKDYADETDLKKLQEIVQIRDNTVYVKLNKNSDLNPKSYSFFNDIYVSSEVKSVSSDDGNKKILNLVFKEK